MALAKIKNPCEDALSFWGPNAEISASKVDWVFLIRADNEGSGLSSGVPELTCLRAPDMSSSPGKNRDFINEN